jgi:hypothetical protein
MAMSILQVITLIDNEIDHYRFQSQSFALAGMKEESLEHEHIKMVLENILKQIKDKNGKYYLVNKINSDEEKYYDTINEIKEFP